MHQLQRGGVNHVAAEIAEKIGMLFQNENVDARPGEKHPKQHSRRPAPNDTATGPDGFRARRAGHDASSAPMVALEAQTATVTGLVWRRSFEGVEWRRYQE
jgi:hypothetical protein